MFLHLSVSHSVHMGVSRPRPRGRLGGLAGGCPGPHSGVRLQGLAGGCPGPHSGVRLRGLAGGVQAHTWGGGRPRPRCVCVCISACTEADTLPSRWLLLQVVRILLECILVLTALTYFGR